MQNLLKFSFLFILALQAKSQNITIIKSDSLGLTNNYFERNGAIGGTVYGFGNFLKKRFLSISTTLYESKIIDNAPTTEEIGSITAWDSGHFCLSRPTLVNDTIFKGGLLVFNKFTDKWKRYDGLNSNLSIPAFYRNLPIGYSKTTKEFILADQYFSEIYLFNPVTNVLRKQPMSYGFDYVYEFNIRPNATHFDYPFFTFPFGDSLAIYNLENGTRKAKSISNLTQGKYKQVFSVQIVKGDTFMAVSENDWWGYITLIKKKGNTYDSLLNINQLAMYIDVGNFLVDSSRGIWFIGERSNGQSGLWCWKNGQISRLISFKDEPINAIAVSLVIDNFGAKWVFCNKAIVRYNELEGKFKTDTDTLILCPNQKMQFTDLSKTEIGSISRWNWDFGDGFTSNNKNPSHKYTQPGTYRINLSVVNSFGTIGNFSKQVVILNPESFSAVPNSDTLSLCDDIKLATNLGSFSKAKWILPEGDTISNEGGPIKPVSPGIYKVLFQERGCSLFDSLYIGNISNLVYPISIESLVSDTLTVASLPSFVKAKFLGPGDFFEWRTNQAFSVTSNPEYGLPIFEDGKYEISVFASDTGFCGSSGKISFNVKSIKDPAIKNKQYVVSYFPVSEPNLKLKLVGYETKGVKDLEVIDSYGRIVFASDNGYQDEWPYPYTRKGIYRYRFNYNGTLISGPVFKLN